MGLVCRGLDVIPQSRGFRPQNRSTCGVAAALSVPPPGALYGRVQKARLRPLLLFVPLPMIFAGRAAAQVREECQALSWAQGRDREGPGTWARGPRR